MKGLLISNVLLAVACAFVLWKLHVIDQRLKDYGEVVELAKDLLRPGYIAEKAVVPVKDFVTKWWKKKKDKTPTEVSGNSPGGAFPESTASVKIKRIYLELPETPLRGYFQKPQLISMHCALLYILDT